MGKMARTDAIASIKSKNYFDIFFHVKFPDPVLTYMEIETLSSTTSKIIIVSGDRTGSHLDEKRSGESGSAIAQITQYLLN